MPRLIDLPTPLLVLDRPRMLRNIARFHDRAAALGVTIRPHVKTPKSIDIARHMLARQARGIAVSTLREAEYFAGHGIDDIFYAVPMAPDKVPRAAALLRQGVALSCATHNLSAVALLAACAAAEGVVLPLLIDVDVDHYRSGVEASDPEFLAIALTIHAAPSLRLAGIMIYGGRSYDCDSPAAMGELAERIRVGGLQARDRLLGAGLPCEIVSYGSSPGTTFARSMEGITESRAGVYVFQDLFQAGIGACAIDDVALSVVTTVTGQKAAQNRLIIDAGGLALSKDRSTGGRSFDCAFGLVAELESGRVIADLHVSSASQEVGIVTTQSGAPIDMARYPVGCKLRILPNHACFTAAAYDEYHVVDGDDRVAERWGRVNGW